MIARQLFRSMFVLAAGMLLIPTSCFASAGETGAIFLNMGVNAKAEAMGGAYSAIADDASAVTINPGGMMQLQGQQVTVMHNEYLLDMNQEYFAYVSKIGKRAIGGSLLYLDTGSQSNYTAGNVYQYTFRPTSYALSFAYGADAGKVVSYGVALKYIKEKIDTFSGTAFALDAGMIYKPTPNGWRYAATLTNLGSDISLDQESDPLPLTLKLGAAYQWENMPMISAFDLYMIRDEDPEYHLGLQYTLQKLVALRLGYNSGFDAGSGFTFGVGVKQNDFGADYAFIPSKDLGDSHRFSFSMNF